MFGNKTNMQSLKHNEKLNLKIEMRKIFRHSKKFPDISQCCRHPGKVPKN